MKFPFCPKCANQGDEDECEWCEGGDAFVPDDEDEQPDMRMRRTIPIREAA